MSDLIDRQAAIKEIENEFAEVLTSHGYASYEKANIFYQLYCEGLMDAIGILLDMEAEQPSAEPCNMDEWCEDCKEYDHEKHCCPRFNRVIRAAMEEAKGEGNAT